MVKNLPTMEETWVRSPGQKDLLEKETTPVLLPRESHGQEEPGELQSMGSQESDMNERLTL